MAKDNIHAIKSGPEDLKKVAANMLTSSIPKFFSGKDTLETVPSLRKVCKVHNRVYGATASECAEPHYYFCKAVLTIYGLKKSEL